MITLTVVQGAAAAAAVRKLKLADDRYLLGGSKEKWTCERLTLLAARSG